ncbi:MAG: PilZ domain-containing protein [Thermodesulfobacteriota bacterium]
MKKPVIDAREVLNDLRAGMEDGDLMKKYNLSSLGVQSLFNKLTQAGLIREISPRELLRDISAGLSPEKLMEKHKLSQSALSRALSDLDLFGLLERAERKQTAAPTVRINASEVVSDIRTGMGDRALMAKYGLSAGGLQRLYDKILEAGAMTREELLAASTGSQDTVTLDALRQSVRHYPVLSLAAVSLKHDEAMGVVRDISETGVGISGFACKVGEEDTLIVKADAGLDVEPLVFEAKCRWSKVEDNTLEVLSGYEITDITDRALKNLRAFLRAFSVLFDGEK